MGLSRRFSGTSKEGVWMMLVVVAPFGAVKGSKTERGHLAPVHGGFWENSGLQGRAVCIWGSMDHYFVEALYLTTACSVPEYCAQCLVRPRIHGMLQFTCHSARPSSALVTDAPTHSWWLKSERMKKCTHQDLHPNIPHGSGAWSSAQFGAHREADCSDQRCTLSCDLEGNH